MSFLYFYDPETELDRLFEDAFTCRVYPHAWTPPTAEAKHGRHGVAYRPRVNVHESKDANTVTATFELPGLTSDNVTIDMHQNHLTVSGEFPVPSPGTDSQEGAEETYKVRERRVGKFSRTLQVPLGIKPEDVKAKMEHGVLTISFPKTLPDQPSQRIVIG